MIRILLSGMCLLILIPVQKANARAGSPNLRDNAGEVFDNMVPVVSAATKIAVATGVRVRDVMETEVPSGGRGLAAAGAGVANGITINNFVTNLPGSGVSSGGSGSGGGSVGTNTNTGINNAADGVGSNSNTQPGGASAFTANAGSGTSGVGSSGSDSGSLANATGFVQSQDYAALSAENFKGMVANYDKYFSNLSDTSSDSVDNIAAKSFQEGIKSGVKEVLPSVANIGPFTVAVNTPSSSARDQIALGQRTATSPDVFLETAAAFPMAPRAPVVEAPKETPKIAAATKPEESKASTSPPSATGASNTNPSSGPLVMNASGQGGGATSNPISCETACRKLNDLGVVAVLGKPNVPYIEQEVKLIAKEMPIPNKTAKTRITEAKQLLETCNGSKAEFKDFGLIEDNSFSFDLIKNSECRRTFVTELSIFVNESQKSITSALPSYDSNTGAAPLPPIKHEPVK